MIKVTNAEFPVIQIGSKKSKTLEFVRIWANQEWRWLKDGYGVHEETAEILNMIMEDAN